MSLEHLIVKPATDAQTHEALLREAAYWGAQAGVSVDDYVKISAIFAEGDFARQGRVKTWVLAPEDDCNTTNFYASCQVLTRDILMLQPGRSLPITSFGHAITAVIVPPELRGKGYAKRLMSLMHSVLAPHRYPSTRKTPTVADHASTVSVLYSAIGDYYSHCVPSEGESGWTIQKSLITTWHISSIQTSSSQGELSPSIELLSESDVSATLDSDDFNIPDDLLRLQKRDPTKTFFAFVPTTPLNEYSMFIGKLLLDKRPILSWGAKIRDRDDFMTWAFFGRPNLQLVVTRLRATVDSFRMLLNIALQVARDTKCESIEVWNVPEHLKEVVRETGGNTTERADYLSAFKWYGQQADSKVDGEDVIWALDER